MILAPLVASTAMLQSAIPPALPQETADCLRPVYASDRLVCSDPRLRSMDARLKALIERKRGAMPASPFIETQENWFRRSRRCAFRTDHRACLAAAYSERFTVWNGGAVTATPLGRCDNGAIVSLVDGGAVLTRGADVIAVGVAWSKAWRPFVTLSKNGGSIRLSDLGEQNVAICRLSRSGRQ